MKRVYEGDRKEARRQATQAYRAADPDRSRRQWRDYRERKLLEATGGRPKPEACEQCGRAGLYGGKTRICFDHDHKTGRFRGWLCHHCNLIVGHADDKPELLRKLADYLEAANGVRR